MVANRTARPMTVRHEHGGLREPYHPFETHIYLMKAEPRVHRAAKNRQTRATWSTRKEVCMVGLGSNYLRTKHL